MALPAQGNVRAQTTAGGIIRRRDQTGAYDRPPRAQGNRRQSKSPPHNRPTWFWPDPP
jgi:hypothetical protein